MKSMFITLVLLALAATPAYGSQVSPIEKVLDMISGLQQQVIAAGTDSQNTYDKYAAWCEDRSQKIGFEIKTGRADVAEAKATIEEQTSFCGALESKIEELSGDIQTDESDLNAATGIRKKESADFSAEETELNQVLGMLERASSILGREAKKDGASMLQTKSAQSLTEALETMVEASVIDSADASRLTALVQTSHESEDADADSDMGNEAPASESYEGHSDGILGVLEGLTDKAEAQLAKARKSEGTSVQNYEMLKQSLLDAVRLAQNDMAKAKKDLAEGQEKTAIAKGDLEVATTDLAEDMKTKQTLHQDCMNAAEEFELATKSRAEELNALATAKRDITDSSGGAAKQAYGLNQVSLLQLGRAQIASESDVSKSVRLIRDIAQKTHSTELAQLASRMSSAVRLGEAVAGGDPFAKVKELLSDMMSALEDEAANEASHKAYCDKELGASGAKRDDLTTEADSLSTKIAQAKAASAKLKQQVATLQNELAGMSKAKAVATQLRATEKAAYEENSAQMKQGVDGIQKALKVLKEYYAAGDGEAAGSGILGLLEVCETDFTKGLAELTSEEESSAAEYEQYTREDQVAAKLKDQDVKYKNKEAAGLDKAVSELEGDHASVSDELAAVHSGLERLKDMCVAKSLPYEERKRRREAELDGLKQALQILDGPAMLLQKTSRHTLRGVHPHRTSA